MSTFSRLRALFRSNLSALLLPDDETTLDDEWERPSERRQSQARTPAPRAPRQPDDSRSAAYRSRPPHAPRPPSEKVQAVARLEAHYVTLEVPVGADLSTIKHSFRRLMRTYHPDLQQGQALDEEQTERVQRLIVAYTELTRHLGGR